MIRIDRLGEKVEGALFHRGHGVLNAAERRHDDDRQFGIELFRRAQHTKPVAIRQAQIRQHDARARRQQGGRCLLLVTRLEDRLALRHVERALAQRRLATENVLLKEELASRRGAPQIVGEDAHLKQVSVTLQRAAGTDTTVLLEEIDEDFFE